MTDHDILLRVEDLRIRLKTRDGTIEPVRGVSFTLGRERLGIVGESGSGKSLTARALLGLLPRGGETSAAELRLGTTDLLSLRRSQWQRVRGRRISMILQDPRHALHPARSIGSQIVEVLQLHLNLSHSDAWKRAGVLLESVRIRDPERVLKAFPHEVSGGMGQRAMIALMIAAQPDVLVADEPTSALDLTVQNQVLSVLDEQVASRGMGLILISHDLDLVARFCDRILVMYAGQIVEELASGELENAQHPYTRGLLACAPRLAARGSSLPVLTREASWLEDAAA